MYLIALSAYIKFYDTQNGLRIVDEGESEGGLKHLRSFLGGGGFDNLLTNETKKENFFSWAYRPPYINKQFKHLKLSTKTMDTKEGLAEEGKILFPETHKGLREMESSN